MSIKENLLGWLKKLFYRDNPANSYSCNICGKIHSGLPMDMAYVNPADYFMIPPNERAERIRKDEDVCVIDNDSFYIRGVLPIPVIDSNNDFRWGTWVKVEECDFKTYMRYWEASASQELPILKGYLSGGLKPYPESDMMQVDIHLQSDNQRPIFRVPSSEAPLAIDQQKGITMKQVHTFVEPIL